MEPRKTAALLPLLLLLAGCAGLVPDADRLKVNLASLEVQEAGLLEQRFLARLRIQNRGRDPLEVEGLTFDLRLNGREFASGVSNRRLTIEGLSEGVVEVPLTATLFGLVRQVQALQELEGRTFRYAFSGTLYTRGVPFGLPFADEGEIELAGGPVSGSP